MHFRKYKKGTGEIVYGDGGFLKILRPHRQFHLSLFYIF